MEDSRGYPAVWEASADLEMAKHQAIYLNKRVPESRQHLNTAEMPRIDNSRRPPVSGTIWSKHGLWGHSNVDNSHLKSFAWCFRHCGPTFPITHGVYTLLSYIGQPTRGTPPSRCVIYLYASLYCPVLSTRGTPPLWFGSFSVCYLSLFVVYVYIYIYIYIYI